MSYTIKSYIRSDNSVPAYEKRLSICLEPNGFSFSETTVKNDLLSLGEADYDAKAPLAEQIASLKACFGELGIQSLGYDMVELVVPARQFAWVPDHLFDATKEKQYLETVCVPEVGKAVMSDHSEMLQSHIVFGADSTLTTAMKIALPGLKVRCQHSKLACQTLADSSDMRSVMLMNLKEGYADFEVFCNHRLQLSNSFGCCNQDEALYHALNLMKTLNLEDDKMVLMLSGNADRELYSRVSRYFPNVELYTGRKLKPANPDMLKVHTYRYAEVLS